jgi:hypothetical protein
MNNIVSVNYDNFRGKIFPCSGLEHFFEYFRGKSGGYSISLPGGLRLDLEIHCRDPRLVVFVFAGAVKKEIRERGGPPYFMARGIGESLEASIVYVSDPSFYLNDTLGLGWYAGSESFRAQSELLLVIKHIGKTLGVNRYLFFGGSGGGFASLYYSSFFENSMALVWNPQVDISCYSAGRFSVVEHYAASAFSLTRNMLRNKILVNLSDIYSSENQKNYVVYLQNQTDRHVTEHMKLLLDRYEFDLPVGCYSGFIGGKFYLHLTDWSLGHKPPPRPVLAYLLERFSRPSLQWAPNIFGKTLGKAEAMARQAKNK